MILSVDPACANLYLIGLPKISLLLIVLQSSLIQDEIPLLELKVSLVRMVHPSLALQ